ncbi:HNH endonuclease [Mariprofundus sp. EBB-1]|uniref:homing endonuclease associated repeat-containing protein n=1 Tax=Mariprofundus sp. EBB-1 TaxID=2650971 RepID=UPI000EF1EBEB|nr:HNH endonuclease [Mariprofundus sp. EBB-1]RLL55930.1 HNH endonuclease [Mariprofundus sp. EBB-1]
MDNQFTFIKAPNTPVSEQKIIDDLKRVAKELSNEKVTQRLYGEHGKYDVTTASRKFGTWNKALEKSGLKTSNVNNVPNEKLFENILNLWEHLGRQPRRSDLTNEISSYSQSPYNRAFTTWTNALQSFVIWANGEELTAPDMAEPKQQQRKTGRDPSLRLRFKVMQRDNFTCNQCGASPAKDQSVELHIDHILAWSKGGDTVLENLQTLCSKCNLGKSNL